VIAYKIDIVQVKYPDNGSKQFPIRDQG